jgi:6-phosphogluconolactonase (cycloisomerase 2 family)
VGKNPGSVIQAIALSPDGKHLFAASAALDAVAVFEVKDLPN